LPPKVAQTRIEWRMAAEHLPFAPRISMAIVCRAVGVLVAAGELMGISASVQLGLTLPVAGYFHRLSWSGLSANLFVVALLAWVVPVGFAAIVTGWSLLGHALSWIVIAMIAIVEWHARLTWLETRVPAPPPWFAALFAIALVAFAWSLVKRKIAQAAGFLFLL